MIKAKPLALAQKLKNIVDICESADAEIEAQKLIQKGALDAGKENDGIEPAVVRKILARRKRLAKDPAETTRQEELGDLYQFMLEGGVPVELPKANDDLSRVMALTNTSKPPKIEAIKKALGCSQGKAHKLRTLAAARLAVKSSSSFDEREHEHSHDPVTGEVTETQESCGDAGSASATHNSHHVGHAEGAVAAPPASPHDTLAPHVTSPFPPSHHRADEAPATPSVGAVAKEPATERVASQTSDDDDLAIPPFLKGSRRTQEGRAG